MDRTLVALEQRYQARQALETLSTTQVREWKACASFRKSLPPTHLPRLVLALAILAIFANHWVIRLASRWVAVLSVGELPGLSESQTRELQRTTASLLKSADLDSGSVLDAAGQLADLNPVALLILTASMLFGGYLVARPLVPAFRLKRQLLGLADQTKLGVADTAASWYVTKAVGSYDLERAVFARLGEQPPREPPFDLVVLAIPLAVLVVPLVPMLVAVGAKDNDWGAPLTYTAVPIVFAALRYGWLWNAWRGRRAAPSRLSQPLVSIGRLTRQPVESRPPTEAGWWLVLSPYFNYIGIPAWYRLAMSADRLRGEAAARNGRSARRGNPELSALAFYFASPVTILVHLWRLSALHQPRIRRWHRLGTAITALLLLASLVLQFVWVAVAVVPLLLLVLSMSAIQWSQNRLTAELAVPLPYGQCEPARPRQRIQEAHARESITTLPSPGTDEPNGAAVRADPA
jgi:hypothetical protein